MKIEIVSTQTIELDLDMLAKAFANLDDDAQAQFFVKVAAIAESYLRPQENQWWYVGRHLRECECSTEGGREVIRSIARAMDYSDQLGDDHGNI